MKQENHPNKLFLLLLLLTPFIMISLVSGNVDKLDYLFENNLDNSQGYGDLSVSSGGTPQYLAQSFTHDGSYSIELTDSSFYNETVDFNVYDDDYFNSFSTCTAYFSYGFQGVNTPSTTFLSYGFYNHGEVNTDIYTGFTMSFSENSTSAYVTLSTIGINNLTTSPHPLNEYDFIPICISYDATTDTTVFVIDNNSLSSSTQNSTITSHGVVLGSTPSQNISASIDRLIVLNRSLTSEEINNYMECGDLSCPLPICDTSFTQTPCEVGNALLEVVSGNYSNLDVYFGSVSRNVNFDNGEYHVSNSRFHYLSDSSLDAIRVTLNTETTFENINVSINTTSVGNPFILAKNYSVNILNNNDVTTTLTIGNVNKYFIFQNYNITGVFNNQNVYTVPHSHGRSYFIDCTNNSLLCEMNATMLWTDVYSDGFTPSTINYVFHDGELQTLGTDYTLTTQNDLGIGTVTIKTIYPQSGNWSLLNTAPSISGVAVYEPIDSEVTLNSTGVIVFFNFSEAVSSSNTPISYDVYLYNALSLLTLQTAYNNTSFTTIFDDDNLLLSYDLIVQACDTYDCENTTQSDALSFCLNEWVAQYSDCVDGERNKTYTDTNSCELQYDIPIDNNTVEDCTASVSYQEELQNEKGIPRSAWLVLFVVVFTFVIAYVVKSGLLFGVGGIIILLSGFFFVPNLTVDKFSSIATILLGLVIFFVGALLSFNRNN